MTYRNWLPCLTVAAFALVATAAPASESWTRVLREDGIVVHQKDVPGQEMPAFRARAAIRGQPLEILAVLQDWEQHPKWRPRCAEAKLVQQVAPNKRFLYSRSDSPWPASDRDVVIYSEFEIEDNGQRITSRFRARSHPKAPPVDGVVRITHLKGHYIIESLDNGSSRVEYQVESDPGGSIPKRMVVRESREMPLNTLKNLRRQVAKSRGRYDDFIQRWTP